ncbi:MAG: restriction endonuclease subunit S [Opitutales bacterium]|nr:restriction endonuclease subunit S [Opitutales bacterium]
MSSVGSVSICLDSKRVPLSKRQREKRQGSFPYYGATSVMDYIDDYLFDETLLLLGEDGSVLKEDGTPFLQYVWGKLWVNNHAHVLKGVSGVSTEELYLFLGLRRNKWVKTGQNQFHRPSLRARKISA